MKKRVILITTSFPFGKGEASFILHELQVLKEKYDVTVISRNVRDAQTTELDASVEVVRYNPQTDVKSSILCIGALLDKGVAAEILKNLKSPKRVIQIIKFVLNGKRLANFASKIRAQYDTDVVFYTYWNDYAAYGITRFLRSDNDYAISRIHGGDLYLRPTNGYFLPFKQYIADNIDRLIFISEDGRDYFMNTYRPQKKEHLTVKRMGTTNSIGVSACSADNVLRILSLSNVTFGKRVQKIAEALADIHEINVEWTHIGDGEEYEQTINNVHQLLDGKENIRYNFLGRLSNDAVKAFLADNAVDVLLNVSYSEGLPVSMMEAASFGVPIIGTDVGGVKEIVTEKNGILLDRDFETNDLKRVLLDFSYLRESAKQEMRAASRDIWEKNFNAAVNYENFVAEVDALWEE